MTGNHLTRLVAFAVVCLSALLPAKGRAQRSSVLDEIDALFADVDRTSMPGYAVGVVRGGRLWYGRGFGAANLDDRIPISDTSVFNVASLSKQFTAACLAILVQRREVSLGDEVRMHIPEFPRRFGPVRLEHLVYMTSGLPEYYRLARAGGRDWDRDYFTVKDAIQVALAQPALEFEPGTRWSYSNINYMLIAEIVERVSGRRFAEFARLELFEPLGMGSTVVNDDVGSVIPNRVTGYNLNDEGGYRRELRRSPHYGGSGVFSSLVDLAKWDSNLRTHRLAGQEFTEIILSTRRFGHPKDDDAFGLVWGEFEGRRILWYEGGDQGFSSYMVHLVDEDLAVFVLSNLGSGGAASRARAVLRVLLGAR